MDCWCNTFPFVALCIYFVKKMGLPQATQHKLFKAKRWFMLLLPSKEKTLSLANGRRILAVTFRLALKRQHFLGLPIMLLVEGLTT